MGKGRRSCCPRSPTSPTYPPHGVKAVSSATSYFITRTSRKQRVSRWWAGSTRERRRVACYACGRAWLVRAPASVRRYGKEAVGSREHLDAVT